jgi:AbiU2
MQTISPEFECFERLVVQLNAEWQMFDKLFLRDANYPLFNRTGRMFWFDIQNCLVDVILQSISRFFDPARNQSQQNLSLQAVISLPKLAPMRADLNRRLEKMRTVWEPGIMVWRHKKLSHSDLPTALGIAALPKIPFSDVQNLVTGITDIAHEIRLRVDGVDVNYKAATGDWVPKVLGHLRDGVKWREENGRP